MKKIKYPPKEKWVELFKRPSQNYELMKKTVLLILNDVKENRDSALKKLTKQFDQIDLESFVVSNEEIEQATNQISQKLKDAIKQACRNITLFHEAQIRKENKVEIAPGVICWRKKSPVEKVGLYIPGGTAPLFSTVLMLGIPAGLAGCKEIVLCTPPDQRGKIHPAVLFSAKEIGLSKIFKVGGAQAIAAMAFGTGTIPKVNKIFGPGNQYVTIAKQMVTSSGVGIDMPAGPSEVLVLADQFADPEFIAADLLSQAEHGIDSQVIFITDDAKLLDSVSIQTGLQLDKLPRKEIAEKALENSLLILVDDLDVGIEMSNQYAPEHLILMVKNHHELATKVVNAGSVFLGDYAPEAAGDYASGTNHVLPTNGYAKNYSGVSVESFMKTISFQEISKKGLESIGPSIEEMAEAEELHAHKNAVSIRLK